MTVNGLLYGADELVGEWVNRHCGGDKPSGPFVAIGYFHGGRIVAGAMFYGYQPHCDISLALAVREPCLGLRGALRAALGYVFVQMDLPRISAEIDVSNARSLDAAARLGFKLEGVKRLGGRDGGHRAIYGLLRKEALV